MERYLILLWFKRFDTVNKGLMRLLAVGLVIGSLFMGIFIADDNGDTLFAFIIGTIISYISILFCFRILIWIYDGIVGNE